MSELSNTDYTRILKYYNVTIPNSKRLIKIEANKILSNKLCRCIKKIEPINGSRSIGICTKTIFNNKGYKRGKFKCKGNQYVSIKNNAKKIRKNYTKKLRQK
jgi:hypothetical protein